MIVVFDLDDTLYEEKSFVRSGFRAVAAYLNKRYTIPAEDSFQYMLQKLKLGRGSIFNDLLDQYNVGTKQAIQKCISVYRTHIPTINLDSEAEQCLNYLNKNNYPIYIVTDGNKLVQRNKIIALGLHQRVKFSYITHCYGIRNAKPSPYCFLKICEQEKVTPSEVVYIGDNPKKDFVGIKPLGFKTIRILKGEFKELRLPTEFEAQNYINSLTELKIDFFKCH